MQGSDGPEPADFRCKTAQWQGFNGPDSVQKIPNLKAFVPKVPPIEFHRRRDMSSAVSLLQGRDSGGALAGRVPMEVLKRRVGQRRQMLAVQAASCSLITLVLLVYCYAGTIPIVIPSTYFVSGIALIGFFVVLSETHVNDRFTD